MPTNDLKQVTAPPEVFFENRTSKYWIKDGNGHFRAYSKTNAKTVLAKLGVEKGEQETILDEAMFKKGIDLILSISGYPQGCHDINGLQVLVPDEPMLITPIPGEWLVLKSIWKGVLEDEQFEWLYWWLASTLQGLYQGIWTPAPVIAFIGETGSCKSLTQSILTKLLGRREARVIQAITGGTAFNGDWAAATHLIVEDDFSENTPKIRQRIKENIKAVAVNKYHRIHPKGAQAFTIGPYWRMSISCNPIEESLAVLPDMDETVCKKLALLLFKRAPMPFPTDSPDGRKKLEGVIDGELPALVHELLNAGPVPEHLRDDEGRCTVMAYHHDEALEAVSQLTPAGQWLREFDELLGGPWQGTAADLHDKLKQGGATYVKGVKSLGRLLTQLCSTHKRRVKFTGKVSGDIKTYRIEAARRNVDE